MFQYTRKYFMRNTLYQGVSPFCCLFLSMMMSGCAAIPDHRIAAEVARPVAATDDEAQYAIATHDGRIGRIVIPVTINGQPNFHLMLDTGATHSVLTSAAANRLGLDMTSAIVSDVQGVTGRIQAPVLNIDRLQAGTLNLRNLRVPIIDGAVVSGLDGILGADGMDSKVISADFIHDRIRVSDAISLPANVLYTVIRFSLVSHRLVVVDGMVGRIPVRAVIDTGGNQTIGNMALLEALVRQHKDQIGMDSGVVDITNITRTGRLLLVPEIKLGPANISNAAVLFNDFTVFTVWNLDKRPTLLIGMDVLGQLGELSINYRRQELQVKSR